jgi:hypothetical protein
MKMTVFWDVAPYSLVKFTDVSEVLAAPIIRAIILMMEAVSICETWVNFYQTTRCNIPEESYLHFGKVYSGYAEETNSKNGAKLSNYLPRNSSSFKLFVKAAGRLN